MTTIDFEYLVGKRIRLLQIGPDPASGRPDPDPIPSGSTGVVRNVVVYHDGGAQIMVKWDPPVQHRTLMLVLPIDTIEVLEDES